MSPDAQVEVLTIILKRGYEDRLAEAVAMLEKAGLHVTHANDDQSIVEGSTTSDKVHGIELLDCVQYVRKVTHYCADYPPGDPRDRNRDGAYSADVLCHEPTRRMGKRYP